MIGKKILGIGFIFVVIADLFIMGFRTPAMNSKPTLSRNVPIHQVSFQVTPTPMTSPIVAIAKENPDIIVNPEANQQIQNQFIAREQVSILATPVVIPDMAKSGLTKDSFSGTYLNKIEAAKFLSEGISVTVINVGRNFFDIEIESGETYRIESPVKPKIVERYVDEYGLSNIRRDDGLEVGIMGTLRSSTPPEDIFGVGPNVIDVTPEASDGILSDEVIPVFTLTTKAVKGPNDDLIIEEMDYTVSHVETTGRKRWFEMYKAPLKGVIWQIFEQSNRYFTMVDKREWDRFTPGYIFSLMRQFEYLIPIPDRIMSIRDPKFISEEEKIRNRYMLHDYTIDETSIRVLIPTYAEIKTSQELKHVFEGEPSVGYISKTASLSDAELGDGEKFTWNSPIKVILYVDGNEFTIYMPLHALLEVNGDTYRVSRSGVR